MVGQIRRLLRLFKGLWQISRKIDPLVSGIFQPVLIDPAPLCAAANVRLAQQTHEDQ